jgi:hypothetical protein
MMVGLDDQEELVRWLESPVQGTATALLMHPVVINAILKITGQRRTHEVDKTQQDIVKNVRHKSRGSGTRARPATS